MKSKTDILAFIRNLPDDDPLLEDLQCTIDGFAVPYVKDTERPAMRKPIEKQYVDETINPAYLVELRDIAIDYNRAWHNYYGRQWPKFAEQVKLIADMAKQSGIDLASYAPEVLTLADIKEVDDIMSATDAQLKQLKHRIEDSHERGFAMLPDVKKKRWKATLQLARRVQELCRKEVPTSDSLLRNASSDLKETWRYLHPIRYALYTLRSNLMSTDGVPQLLEVPDHWIKMAMVMECAQCNCLEYGIDGVLLVVPPRHGKTTIMQAKKALAVIKNGYDCNAIVHHNAEHANARVSAVKEHFLPNTEVGRRRHALFPHVTIDMSRSKNKKELSVYHNGKRQCVEKEGNLQAYGVHSQSQGVTIHTLDADDPSDQKEQSEEGTRQRTNAALAQTWIPRLTGRRKFLIYICTRWHPQDFVGVLMNLVKAGDMKIAYYSMACGGPEDNFAPIWPEAGYDEAYLRGAYGRLGPIMYACQYQNNPDAKEARRIKQLVCFDSKELDPKTRSENYERFFADPATIHFLSVDPAGTSSARSHKAGITYSAFGNLRVGDKDVPRLLFLRFWSLHEGQLGLAQIISDFALRSGFKVDKILVETTSGFHATPEALEVVHGIPRSKVIRRAPGRGSKIERLLRYAIHLEAGDAQFPGLWVTGERGEQVLQLDPAWSECSIQLLQASSADDDHLLDCVRQQLAEVSPDIYVRKYNIAPFFQEPKSRKEAFFDSVLGKKRDEKQREHDMSMGSRGIQNFKHFRGMNIA